MPSDQVGACLTALDECLAKAVDAPVWSLDDARLSRRLGQALAVRARVDELVARLVGHVDERDLGKVAGASSTKAHLVASYRVSGAAAAGLVSQARCLTDRTTTTRTAWATGKVSAEQAVLIGTAVDKLPPEISDEVVEHAQVDLVEHAQSLTFTQLQVVANHLIEVVDPEGADAVLAEQLEAEEARALQQTTFRGRRGFDGIARFSGKMPNLQFDMLTTALEAIASPRRNQTAVADGSGTGAPLSPTAPGTDAGAPSPETDPTLLTYSQRLGRAFVELLEHLPTDHLPSHGAANATIVVTIDHDKLTAGVGEATLTTGTTVSPRETRRLACNAGLLPLMLDGKSAILDLGLARRLFDRYQRIALAVRDQGCIFAGCERPAAWCEAHHITAWQDGGPTDLTNGCLLCNFHHHLIHQGQWAVQMAPDGTPDIIPPARNDPHRTPIRHQRFKPRRH
ncbi:MAG: DUF222 domain-containing protein [Nocardioidaceae bacterium]